METLQQQIDRLAEESVNKEPATKLEFSQEFVSLCDDGRMKVKVTCHNEWLEQPVSVVLNDDRIGILPFEGGHLSKINAQTEVGESVLLFGFFPEVNLCSEDELLYIDGVCKTLTHGAEHGKFGNYS